MTDLNKLLGEAAPGPWEVDMMPAGHQPRIESSHLLIAVVGNGEPWLDAKDEWEANARLIALAPQVVATLIKARQALRRAERYIEYGADRSGPVLRQIRETIADIDALAGGGEC